MRKIILFIASLLLLATVAAAAPATPAALLEGDWLSPKGTLILEIQGQKINGCEITKYEDLVDRQTMGTTVFWLLEEEGERMMQLDWRIMGDDSDYIFLDGKLMLRRDD